MITKTNIYGLNFSDYERKAKLLCKEEKPLLKISEIFNGIPEQKTEFEAAKAVGEMLLYMTSLVELLGFSLEDIAKLSLSEKKCEVES